MPMPPQAVHLPMAAPRSFLGKTETMIASAARDVEALAYPDYLSLDVYATGEGPLR